MPDERFKNDKLPDSILLKIHRQYSKEESVAVLLNEIKRLKFNIGELVSENEELKFELQLSKDKVKNMVETEFKKLIKSNKVLREENNEFKRQKPIPDEVKKDEMVQLYKKEAQLANAKRSEYKIKFLDMSNKFYSANAKILKLEEQLKKLLNV